MPAHCLLTMTHFRGQIRGPHWGPTMDTLLIDFWRKHECLFNSSIESYYDRDFKTKLWAEFALSIGKNVTEVERRSKSLRTQYGRLLWRPEKISTFQQRMLKEKLDFLRPYIVRRRGDASVEEKFIDEDEEEEEYDEEEGANGTIVRNTDGVSGSMAVDEVESEPDLSYEPRSQAATPNETVFHRPPSQPQLTELRPFEGGSSQTDPCPAGRTTAAPKRDVLNQFADVMLADMRQIEDPMALMRLRRDITDLVFKAVEDDARRRRAPSSSAPGDAAQVFHRARPRPGTCSTTRLAFSQRFFERRTKGQWPGRGSRRWEDAQRARRLARGEGTRPGAQRRDAAERASDGGSHVAAQPAEVKTEMESHAVKVEEVTLPLV